MPSARTVEIERSRTVQAMRSKCDSRAPEPNRQIESAVGGAGPSRLYQGETGGRRRAREKDGVRLLQVAHRGGHRAVLHELGCAGHGRVVPGIERSLVRSEMQRVSAVRRIGPGLGALAHVRTLPLRRSRKHTRIRNEAQHEPRFRCFAQSAPRHFERRLASLTLVTMAPSERFGGSSASWRGPQVLIEGRHL